VGQNPSNHACLHTKVGRFYDQPCFIGKICQTDADKHGNLTDIVIKWYNLKSVIGTELFTLKLFKQFTIIIALSFIGEVLHALIPFPIPASIYGILLLFLLLEQKILQVDDVKEVSDFLIFIMPMLFIPSAVGLIDVLDELRASLTAYVTIIIAVTLIVMVATGRITQWFLQNQKEKET
jgi:holin-like protein